MGRTSCLPTLTCAQMTLFHVGTNDIESQKWAASKKTIKPLLHRKMSLLKSPPHVSYQLEKSGQPGADTLCQSMSGFVAGAIEKVLVFITMGSIFMIFSLLWNGMPLARKGKRIIGSRLASLVQWPLN